ncbi:hypothetical protein TWF718_006712 [Orbilia javanica]|uniref:Uncharacterized protein n=1 Tax=Orbilia javanica TaxID=47235 RepID=A0AAN8RHM6_9PEZI
MPAIAGTIFCILWGAGAGSMITLVVTDALNSVATDAAAAAAVAAAEVVVVNTSPALMAMGIGIKLIGTASCGAVAGVLGLQIYDRATASSRYKNEKEPEGVDRNSEPEHDSKSS